MPRITVDLNELACVTAQECVDNLERQAEFLQFCLMQGQPKPDDPELWEWPEKLREAADGIRKAIAP